MNTKTPGPGRYALWAAVIATNVLFVTGASGQTAQSTADDKSSAPTTAPTTAAATPPPPNYSGDLLTRSTLTGDWGGLRNDLAEKGMTLDFSITQIYQGVTGGGQGTGPLRTVLGVPQRGSDTRAWEYSGTSDLLFNLDTGAAKLWQGGFFTVEFEGAWNNGNHVNEQTGAVIPANMNAIYLDPVENGVALSNVSYTQFFSEHVGIFFGKLATVTQTSGDMNDFAHGKGDSNFMNLAFNFNPVALLVPYSTLGAGVVLLPGKKPDDAVITLSAFDPNGVPNSAGWDTLGEDGTVFAGEARVKTNFFGRTGHQLIGGLYSDKLYTSLDQNIRFILDNRQLAKTSGAWSVYYNFDQYLFQTESQAGKDQGWGVFGRFGAADDSVIPIRYFWSVGLGGKGLIDGRPRDGFGIGYYNGSVSDANVPAFVGLGDGWGMEAFYNVAITPWCQLTPDIQYIEGSRSNSEPAWVMGVRLKLLF